MVDPAPERPATDIYDVMARARAGVEELGLRDRHKIDKLERISDAAHKLFGRDGYEGTTLREIAKEAGVALGTLSLYARDKRDLILLIFNRLIPPLLEQGMANARGKADLALSVVAFFEPFYRAYARNVTLYRIVLGQAYGGAHSAHAVQNDTTRLVLIENLSFLVTRAVEAGECSEPADLQIQAKSFYYLYFGAVRAWLGQERPDPEKGLAELLALFQHQVAGLSRPSSCPNIDRTLNMDKPQFRH